MKQLRSFGQIFLIDTEHIQKIFNSLDITGKQVLEIGPGKGVISELLAEKAKNLYCVEVDRRFCDFLRRKFSKKDNVEIIHANILKFQLSKLGNKIIVFGNVPYQISSELIKYLVGYRKYIAGAYFTFQKEFVQKMTAGESDDNYNFLSCYIQYYAKVERIFDIKASAFDPIPKVDSTFSKINFYNKPLYEVVDEDFLFKVIRKAFSSRRKKIINSLPVARKGTALLGENKRKFFSSLGIDPNLRAENISLKEYVLIANKLNGLGFA